jgi:hypothetical protein
VSVIKTPSLLLLLLIASCSQPYMKDHDVEQGHSTVVDCCVEKPCSADPKSYIKCMTADTLQPCGARGCYDYQRQCASNADCHEGYTCQPVSPPIEPGGFGMCQPATCTSDSDCGSPNLRCHPNGVCEHRPCVKSEDCSGWCVAGTCWKQRGFCADSRPSTMP